MQEPICKEGKYMTFGVIHAGADAVQGSEAGRQ